jgi:hypothetical protein
MVSLVRRLCAHDFEQGITAAADFGASRWLTIQRKRVGQADADLLLFLGSNMPRMRLMVSPALMVCSVLKTRWPVSAALKAIFTVSRSRISPTRMTLGAWRKRGAQAVGKL